MATTTATRPIRAAEVPVMAREQRSLWRDAMYRLMRNKAAVAG